MTLSIKLLFWELATPQKTLSTQVQVMILGLGTLELA
jgi:hypothetical protein